MCDCDKFVDDRQTLDGYCGHTWYGKAWDGKEHRFCCLHARGCHDKGIGRCML
jgi:hypothetical protein